MNAWIRHTKKNTFRRRKQKHKLTKELKLFEYFSVVDVKPCRYLVILK